MTSPYIPLEPRDAAEETIKVPHILYKHAEAGGSGSVMQHNVDKEQNILDLYSPQRWPRKKKLMPAAVICFYTFVVYLGSTMTIGMYSHFMEEYKVSALSASLAMSLYVLGYGLGAMVFSPLSEVPSLGRNITYFATFFCFVLCSLGLSLSKNWSLFLFFRFFQGWMGAPALATGAASLHDLFELPEMPYALIAWITAATHTWPMWEFFFLSIICFITMLLFLPETLPAKLAHNYQKRNTPAPRRTKPLLRIPSEASVARIITICFMTVYKPTAIMLTNPAVFFANFYTCLTYTIYYSFFESFPRLFLEEHHFSQRQFSLTFLAIAAGTMVSFGPYLLWARWWKRNYALIDEGRRAERCLEPAVFSSILIPVGLVLFASATDKGDNWIVPLIGVGIETAGLFVVLECLVNYLLVAYQKDAASLLAGNDFMRSVLAAGGIIFSQPMYDHLGVRTSVLLLASLTACCVAGMVALYLWGHKLRVR
ncbi:Caffeine resistance protein-like protein 2 [Elsinoe fawcettii]|nr:Caffeine resistance protein-like protein 2 [Elsinoe fawcettii]